MGCPDTCSAAFLCFFPLASSGKSPQAGRGHILESESPPPCIDGGSWRARSLVGGPQVDLERQRDPHQLEKTWVTGHCLRQRKLGSKIPAGKRKEGRSSLNAPPRTLLRRNVKARIAGTGETLDVVFAKEKGFS